MREYHSTPEDKEKRRQYWIAYRTRPGVREATAERARKYRNSPEGKAKRSEYDHRPETRRRLKENYIQHLMSEYGISREEALVVYNTRIEASFMSPKAIVGLEEEMHGEEGQRFTEMVLDGIPRWKKRRLERDSTEQGKPA
jgi:hypothetical protein